MLKLHIKFVGFTEDFFFFYLHIFLKVFAELNLVKNI